MRTPAEYPFRRAGDVVLCEDGSWVAVEGCRDTGGWERVYNVRVAD